MSTKIYQAYVCGTRLLSESFLPSYRKHCLTAASARVRLLADAVNEKCDHDRLKKVLVKCKQISAGDIRNPLADIDCGFNAWLSEDSAYVIPFGESFIQKGFTPPDGVLDYSYWNNTDRPKKISQRKWDARGKKWSELCLSNWNAGRLCHHVVCARDEIGLDAIAKLCGSGDYLSLLFAVSVEFNLSKAIANEDKP